MSLFFKKKKEEEPEEEQDRVRVVRDVAADDVMEKTDGDEGSAPLLKEIEEKYDEAEWLEDAYEGQLSVDVYETPKEIVIISAIAGVEPEDVDVSINNDMVTIKGTRKKERTEEGDNYFLQECHWGGFSRSIILPTDVLADKIDATLTNGILEVRLPKAGKRKARSIAVGTKKETEKEKEEAAENDGEEGDER